MSFLHRLSLESLLFKIIYMPQWPPYKKYTKEKYKPHGSMVAQYSWKPRPPHPKEMSYQWGNTEPVMYDEEAIPKVTV